MFASVKKPTEIRSNLKVLRSYVAGATLQETLELGRSNRLMSNAQAELFFRSDDQKPKELLKWLNPLEAAFCNLFPFRTGTLMAYPKLGAGFGKWVEFENLVFTVPKHLNGLANSAIVVEQPNYTFEDKNGIIHFNTNGVAIVKDFPQYSGSYTIDQNTAIPKGPKISSFDRDSRVLARTDQEYVGLVVRGGSIGIKVNIDTRSPGELQLGVASINMPQSKPQSIFEMLRALVPAY